jgi:hypothetical protein
MNNVGQPVYYDNTSAVTVTVFCSKISKFEGNEDEFLRVISQYAGSGTGNHKRE